MVVCWWSFYRDRLNLKNTVNNYWIFYMNLDYWLEDRLLIVEIGKNRKERVTISVQSEMGIKSCRDL